jgi:23S rRNA (adenine2503-C2)-methyltransferase
MFDDLSDKLNLVFKKLKGLGKLSDKDINDGLKNILSISYERLTYFLNKIYEKKFRSNQIFKWIYQHQIDNFDLMTNLNKKTIEFLKKKFFIKRLKIKLIKKSKDGSKKILFQLKDYNIIETLIIPEKKHFTICISTQVGCAQKCRFCMSGNKGLIRNLSSGEIISQIRDIKKYIKNKEIPINIVLMGIGEPLSNYNEVIKALIIISNNDYGLKISKKRITISTSGIIPKIEELPSKININLAISLNASNNKLRSFLMPINKHCIIKGA